MCIHFQEEDGLDMEELILDLIDYDVEDEYEEDDEEGTITIMVIPRAMPYSETPGRVWL